MAPLTRRTLLAAAVSTPLLPAVITSTAGSAAAAPGPLTHYLLAHFTGESATGEQIYFATSVDGLRWNDLNGSQPVLLSGIGERGVRDPSIVRSPSGDRFWLLATDLRIASGKGWEAAQYDGSTALVIWESADLITWSEPWLADVAATIPQAGCAWAPEAIYEPESGDYIVYWATISPMNGITKDRIFFSRTRDFRTFTPAQVYIDRPGTQNIIDTQIIEVPGSVGGYRYIRASRDAQITLEGAQRIQGPWTRTGDLSGLGLTGAQVEGPILHQFHGRNEWGLWVDQYARGLGYLLLTTTNLASPGAYRARASSEYALGAVRKRHGGILGVTTAQHNALNARWGTSGLRRLQSFNYPERFVRHNNFAVRLDAGVTPAADSWWRPVAGLNQAPGTVSFESSNFPGHYLRHQSFAATLAPNDGSDAFAADATFTQVAGLAEASGVSFRSVTHPTRYLRHTNFILRLEPAVTATDRADATFRLVN